MKRGDAERLGDVLEAMLDRLDSIDRRVSQLVGVAVSNTRDIAQHDSELTAARHRLLRLERRIGAEHYAE